MTFTIAVQSPASSVRKFMEKSNISTATVRTPLWMLANNASIRISEQAVEEQEKDLCFVQCNSKDLKDKIILDLDNHGFSLPEIHVDLDEDKTTEEDRDIEDILNDAENKNEESNYHRTLDFWSRVTENTIFGSDQIDSPELDFDIKDIQTEEELNEKLKEATESLKDLEKSVSTIVDFSTLSIVPHMFPEEVAGVTAFFIPSMGESLKEMEIPSVVSNFYLVNFDAGEHDEQAGIKAEYTPEGRFLIADNALVLSAIEGIVPGYVVITLDPQECDEDKIPVFMWRVSHNWVEGLSVTAIQNSKEEDTLSELLADYYLSDQQEEDQQEELSVNVYPTEDIMIDSFPFIKEADLPKDLVVELLEMIGNSKG